MISTPTPAREELGSYFKSMKPIDRHAFAKRAETSVGYLRNLIDQPSKPIGPVLALNLEIASGGVLKADQLCPTFDWPAAARGRCSCDKHIG